MNGLPDFPRIIPSVNRLPAFPPIFPSANGLSAPQKIPPAYSTAAISTGTEKWNSADVPLSSLDTLR